jgi:dienelactone hydrolase
MGLRHAIDRQLWAPRSQKHMWQRSAVRYFFDAYRGLNFLVRQQFVDPKRVAVMGFSQGGWITLSSVERGAIEQTSANKFRAAAAIYPLCNPIKGPMTVPTLIMIGECDDWTAADACRKLAAGQDDLGTSRPEDAAIQLIVYPKRSSRYDLAYLQTSVTFLGHHLEFNKSATYQSTDALREFLRSMVGDRP